MFVKVNDKILDYENYRRKLTLVKSYARQSLREALSQYGFKNGGNGFYSEELGVEVEVVFEEKMLEYV